MKCSVIILNWNGEAMLRRYLPSVLLHTQGEGIEIVVADNGSTDRSRDYLRTQPVRLLHWNENYGFAEGYNRAIAQTDADYVVLLNSDVEVAPQWLQPLLAYMDAHPQTAAVQPKVLSWRSKEDYLQGKARTVRFEHAGAAGGMIDALGYPYCRGRLMSYTEEDHGQYDTPASVFWVTGACMLIRTRLYREAGGLDGTFFAHQEEIDLCWRLQCRGYEIACVPQSAVYHLGGGALGYENPRKTYLNFRNNLLMLYKNLPACSLWRVMAVRCVLDYVAALPMWLSGHSANARAVLQARRDFHRMRKNYTGLREENLRKAVVKYPQAISRRSIVADYYLRGRRR